MDSDPKRLNPEDSTDSDEDDQAFQDALDDLMLSSDKQNPGMTSTEDPEHMHKQSESDMKANKISHTTSPDAFEDDIEKEIEQIKQDMQANFEVGQRDSVTDKQKNSYGSCDKSETYSEMPESSVSENVSLNKESVLSNETISQSGMELNTEDGTELPDEEEDAEEEDTDDEREKEVVIDEDAIREMEAQLTEEEIQERKDKAQKFKEEGNTDFREGNYEIATSKYTEALQACPLKFAKERSIMYSNRAACKLHQDKTEGAIEDCSKALELNPNYLKALVRRAELYEKMEKLDEALTDYQKALEMDPSLLNAREACMRLPDQIKERNEKMKEEMMSKLKDLGNLVLRPFGLSTNNFKLQQDPNTGGYSVQFQQNQPQPPAP